MDDNALTLRAWHPEAIRGQGREKTAGQKRARTRQAKHAQLREIQGSERVQARGGRQGSSIAKAATGRDKAGAAFAFLRSLSAVSCWLGPSNPLKNEPNPDTLSSR